LAGNARKNEVFQPFAGVYLRYEIPSAMGEVSGWCGRIAVVSVSVSIRRLNSTQEPVGQYIVPFRSLFRNNGFCNRAEASLVAGRSRLD
jgi:hypothetical protein